MSTRLNRQIVSLAMDVGTAPPDQSEAALRDALAKLTHWIGASNGYWIAAVRQHSHQPADALLGWRPRELLFLHDHETMTKASLEMAERMRHGEVDLATLANLQRAGTTRALLRRELVPDRVWNRSWVPTEYQQPRGVFDQLVGAHTVGPEHESYVGLVRGARDRRFGAAERDLLLLFMEASRFFHKRLLLFRGWMAVPALTLRERDVLALLATARTEKQIASELRIGERTVHQHALSIYEKLGVRGRIGLLATLQ